MGDVGCDPWWNAPQRSAERPGCLSRSRCDTVVVCDVEHVESLCVEAGCWRYDAAVRSDAIVMEGGGEEPFGGASQEVSFVTIPRFWVSDA